MKIPNFEILTLEYKTYNGFIFSLMNYDDLFKLFHIGVSRSYIELEIFGVNFTRYLKK